MATQEEPDCLTIGCHRKAVEDASRIITLKTGNGYLHHMCDECAAAARYDDEGHLIGLDFSNHQRKNSD